MTKPAAIDLRRLATSPAAFRDSLYIPGHARPFGAILAEFQRRDFAAMDPAIIALSAGRTHDPRRFWIERTKGGSKDTDVATCILWLLAFSRRPLRIQAAARDSDQADEVRLIVRQILAMDAPLNRALAERIEVQRSSIVNDTTGSTADILTADKFGSHGARPDLLLCNELSHVGDEEFMATLLDNADKCPHAVVIIATNAGHRETWQEKWRAIAQESPRWFFSALSHPSPWVSEADLAESEKRNPPSRFRRLWWGEWSDAGGDALRQGDITAVFAAGLPPMTGGEPGWVFGAGVDGSVSQDHTTFVVVGKSDRGRYRVAKCWRWVPPRGGKIDQAEVERTILAAAREFSLRRVLCDPFQLEYLVQRLQRERVKIETRPQSGRALVEQAMTLLSEIGSHNLDAYGHPALENDLRRLRVEERSYGMRLVSDRSTAEGHGDLATALSIGLVAASGLSTSAPGVYTLPINMSEAEQKEWIERAVELGFDAAHAHRAINPPLRPSMQDQAAAGLARRAFGGFGGGGFGSFGGW